MAQVAERVFVRDEAPAGDRIERHAAVDRVFHWLTAVWEEKHPLNRLLIALPIAGKYGARNMATSLQKKMPWFFTRNWCIVF